MKIILVSVEIEPRSGWGTTTHNYALYFFRQGIPFTLLLPKSAKRMVFPYIKDVKYVLPNLPLSFSNVRDWWKIFKLWPGEMDSMSDSSLIHCLVDFPYAAWSYHLAKKMKLSLVFGAHGTYSVAPFVRFPDRYLMLPTYRGAAAVMAVSNFTANKMREVSGYDRDIDVVYNPISHPVDCPAEEEDWINENFSPEEKVILSIGQIKKRKGLDILIKAMPKILGKIPNARLVIGSSIGDESIYKNLAEDLGISKNILIVKPLTSEKLAGLYSRCNIFALTSRYIDHQFEGYGVVYGEAGLLKKPVVAADSGGVSDAVRDNETGILVPENNVEATAEAIVKILSDDSLARRLGEGGFKFANERNWDNYMKKVLTIYETVSTNHSKLYKVV